MPDPTVRAVLLRKGPSFSIDYKLILETSPQNNFLQTNFTSIIFSTEILFFQFISYMNFIYDQGGKINVRPFLLRKILQGRKITIKYYIYLLTVTFHTL